MTHEGRFIAGTGVWTGGAFEASRRLSCRRRCRRTTASPLAWARASSHAAARATKPQLACDVRGDVAHPAVGGVEGLSLLKTRFEPSDGVVRQELDTRQCRRTVRRPSAGCVLPERNMGPNPIVIGS